MLDRYGAPSALPDLAGEVDGLRAEVREWGWGRDLRARINTARSPSPPPGVDGRPVPARLA